MSWTTPVTFVTGNILTAAQLNTYLRDNTLALRGAPRCRVRISADQSIPDDTTTTVLFDTEDIDTHGMHSTSSNTERLTTPSGWAGDYLVVATVKFDTSTAGFRRYGELRINNAVTITTGDFPPPTSATASHAFGLSTLWFPLAGDYFSLHVVQNSGGNLDVIPYSYGGTHMAAYFVGSGAG